MPAPRTRARVGFGTLRFNRETQRYIGPNGRFLPAGTVRDIIDADIEVRKARFSDLDPTTPEATEEVAALHLAEHAAAKGGYHRMGPSDYTKVQKRIDFHLERLEAFRNDLAAGRYTDADGNLRQELIAARMQCFADAGLNTYETQRLEEHRKAGFLFEENELETQAHHCEGPDSCPAQTARGRVLIGTCLIIGGRRCKMKCRCRMNYFKSPSPAAQKKSVEPMAVRDARGKLLFTYDPERQVVGVRRDGVTTEVELEKL